MAYTVTQVVSAVRQVFPDIADADIVSLVNEGHQELTMMVKLYPETVVDINLTADAQEYSLNDAIQRIWSAAYLKSATDWNWLEPMSQDELDIEYTYWRNQDSSQPGYYYVMGNKIGLYPKPDTTTSGGYPILRLYTGQSVTLTSGSSLPTQVPTLEPWKWYACKEIASEKYPDRFEFYEKRYTAALNTLLANFTHRRVSRYTTTMLANIPRVRR